MLILFGFLSGVIGGMGIGGGTVLIPALTLLLGFEQKTAQLINLLCFMPTAAAALYDHKKNNRLETGMLKYMIVFGIIGCIAGAVIAVKTDNEILKRFFGAFRVIMGIREIRQTE